MEASVIFEFYLAPRVPVCKFVVIMPTSAVVLLLVLRLRKIAMNESHVRSEERNSKIASWKFVPIPHKLTSDISPSNFCSMNLLALVFLSLMWKHHSLDTRYDSWRGCFIVPSWSIGCSPSSALWEVCVTFLGTSLGKRGLDMVLEFYRSGDLHWCLATQTADRVPRIRAAATHGCSLYITGAKETLPRLFGFLSFWRLSTRPVCQKRIVAS